MSSRWPRDSFSAVIVARIVSATPYTFVSTIDRQCSGESSRKPRAAPKPALANATSRRPNRSSARLDHRLLLLPLGDVALDRERAVLASQLGGELLQPFGGPGGQHHAVAGLRREPAVAAPMPLDAPVIRKTGSDMPG